MFRATLVAALLTMPAHAAGPAGFEPMSLMPIALLGLVFYFFLIRPQQKKAQEHKKMISEVSRGDHVLTNGGILAKVSRVDEGETLIVEIAEGVRVQIMKQTISQVLDKTFPFKLEKRDATPSVTENAKSEARKKPVTKK